MHLFDTVSILVVLTLVGVEFSVSAFVNPALWRLDAAPQAEIVRRFALVLGNVMRFWYPACALLLGTETWLRWHNSGLTLLLAADALWVFASLASLVLLVPLNTRIANGDIDWQRLHHLWDSRHRVRIPILAAAAALLTYDLVR